jgi:hypothetical protein
MLIAGRQILAVRLVQEVCKVRIMRRSSSPFSTPASVEQNSTHRDMTPGSSINMKATLFGKA